MSKFYAVHGVPYHADDFELLGIFTKETDAEAFVVEQKECGLCKVVASPQHLGMPVILDLLTRDRLHELAPPLVLIAEAMGLQVKTRQNLFERELAAWRERFPAFYFRSMDDCIERREPK